MSHWEQAGKSDEWYTPKYIFDAMGVFFDCDVAHPKGVGIMTPCQTVITERSLDSDWRGMIWMNPPFGGRNGLLPWLEKFFAHGNGVALTPDRTSAPWYHYALKRADAMLVIKGRVKFIRPCGAVGANPNTGTTLWASGVRAVHALANAERNNLGTVLVRMEEWRGTE